MMPLIQPPLGYITHGPWLVTFEWEHGLLTVYLPDLPHAIFKFWDSMDHYGAVCSPSAPPRRVLVDARGVTVLGSLALLGADPSVVATKEVIDLQESLGANPLDMIELELEIRWCLETKR